MSSQSTPGSDSARREFEAGSIVINAQNIAQEEAHGASATRGPIVLAHCTDGSGATFELDREGSTQIVTGRFAAPDAKPDAQPLRLSAEFRRADSEDDRTIAFSDLAGSVLRVRPTGKTDALALKSLVFSEVQDGAGGHVSLQYGRTQLELSGCQFNIAVLERVRGQEHLPFVLVRAK